MDFDELNSEMGRKRMSRAKLAQKIGISKNAMYARFEGKVEFNVKEIKLICKALGLDKERMEAIFFADWVSQRKQIAK